MNLSLGIIKVLRADHQSFAEIVLDFSLVIICGFRVLDHCGNLIS